MGSTFLAFTETHMPPPPPKFASSQAQCTAAPLCRYSSALGSATTSRGCGRSSKRHRLLRQGRWAAFLRCALPAAPCIEMRPSLGTCSAAPSGGETLGLPHDCLAWWEPGTQPLGHPGVHRRPACAHPAIHPFSRRILQVPSDAFFASIPAGAQPQPLRNDSLPLCSGEPPEQPTGKAAHCRAGPASPGWLS